MAPSVDSTYLPAIAACLDTPPKLLSWKSVASQLDNIDSRPLDITTTKHLQDPATQQVLANCFTPAKPNARSKAELEKLTAAINVAPESNGRYDVKEIKEDALWLSEKAQIDEIEALRFTILEWQSRPAQQALLNATDEEAKAFNSLEQRRQRLLEVFLSESQWLFRCVEVLVAKGVYRLAKQPKRSKSEFTAIEQAASIMTREWHLNSTSSSKDSKTWLNRSKDLVQKLMESVETGSDILTKDGMEQYTNESMHALATETWMSQISHTLRIVLLIQWSSSGPSTPQYVLDWFSWMDTKSFFGVWFSRVPGPFVHHKIPIMELIILCSLSFIDLAASAEILPDLATTSAVDEAQNAKVYLQSLNCITELSRIFMSHLDDANAIVAPVSIAWCSLLSRIHSYAAQSIEHRETRQTQKAIDNYGASQQSDNESLDGSTGRRRVSPQRRASFGSDTSGPMTLFEEIDDINKTHPMGEDAVSHYGRYATVDLGGFAIIESVAKSSLSRLDGNASAEVISCIREILLQFVKSCIDLGSLQYSPPVLDIVFSILGARDGFWDSQITSETSSGPTKPLYSPLGDDPLLRDILACARGRFPLESIPFIELCRSLVPFQEILPDKDDLLLDVISNLEGFTSVVLEPQMPYDLVGEGDNLQLHLLQSHDALSIAFPALSRGRGTPDDSDLLVIPSGTRGQALRDEKPLIALWELKYSGLRFCGSCLQLLLRCRSASLRVESLQDYSHLYLLSTEIIGMLATWLVHIASQEEYELAREQSASFLANVSDDLSRNEDVVAVIFELLEGELYKNSPSGEVADFVFRSTQFLLALAKVMPSRVWSFLSHSGFLGLHGQENRLSAIITAYEMPTGSYNILLTSIQLLNILVQDSVRGQSSRKGPSMAVQRFCDPDTSANVTGVHDITMKKILRQYSRLIVDVLETSHNWKFQTQEYRLSLKLEIYSTLSRMIAYTYNYDDESSAEQKLSADLAPAVEYIVDNFLSVSSNDGLLSALVQDLIDTAVLAESSMPSKFTVLRHAVAKACLNFMSQLLRLNKSQTRATYHLAGKTRDAVPVLVSLFIVYDELRLPVVQLLDATIRDTGSSAQAAPLLAGLSEKAAKAFIQSVLTLGMPPADPQLSAATWSLFSAAVTYNQQWFAVYLLSGKSPKDSLKDKDKNPPPSSSAIRVALNKMTRIESLDHLEAVKLLEFIALSANLWMSVTKELRKDKDCRDACLRYLSNLKPARQDGNDIEANLPMRLQTAAYIVNILALLVHQSNQFNDLTTLRHIVPSIKYLVDHAAKPPSYNASLHHGLQKNFEHLFSGSKLQHFKRTTLGQPLLGNDFYYDTNLADSMFRHNPAWTGKGSKGSKGFVTEFVRANLNLSLVEAQINLFHSWKSLVIELNEGLGEDQAFQATVTTVIKSCLQADQGLNMPEAIFRTQRAAKADLAFTLLQQLVVHAGKSKDLTTLLETTWISIQPSAAEIGIILGTEDANYVRVLLRILYLTLCVQDQVGIEEPPQENLATSIALNVLEKVVAAGFRSLIGQLHEDASKVLPQDFALLIAILQAALKITGVSGHSERLLAHFADERTIQRAGTLVSWSDQLTTNGDPIYGELSISFLHELSSIPVLAEAIVVSGTYAQVASTTLFSFFRRQGGCGPFDNPSRLFTIWAQAFLPLTLNVIGSIGAPIAVEIATMFTQFTPQLARAAEQFDPKVLAIANGRLSLSMFDEAHYLALLHVVLTKFTEAGSSVGIIPTEMSPLEWDASSVKEDLESLLARRHALRESITPTDEHEDAWSRQKPKGSGSDAQNRLEERIVEEISATLALLGSTE